MKWIGPLIVSICVVVPSLSGGDASARQTSQYTGLALARRMCSECHAVERKTVSSRNLDAPSFKWIANEPGMTANFLSVEIRRRHRKPMPDINLNADQQRDIIAYILSLQTAK
jgi:mono/diheme cytochrome c family protein